MNFLKQMNVPKGTYDFVNVFSKQIVLKKVHGTPGILCTRHDVKRKSDMNFLKQRNLPKGIHYFVNIYSQEIILRNTMPRIVFSLRVPFFGHKS